MNQSRSSPDRYFEREHDDEVERQRKTGSLVTSGVHLLISPSTVSQVMSAGGPTYLYCTIQC